MRVLLLYAPSERVLAERLSAELRKVPRLVLLLNETHNLLQMDLVLTIIPLAATDPRYPIWEAVNIAQSESIPVYPVLTGGGVLPERLEGFHHLDLSQNLEAGIRKLVAEMKNRVGIPDVVTAPLNPDPLEDQLAYLDETEKITRVAATSNVQRLYLWIGLFILLGLGGIVLMVMLQS